TAPLNATIDSGPADAGLSDHILLRVAAAHLAAGLAFATSAAVILLTMSGLELFPLRTAIIIWSLAWPTVMVLSLLVGPDRRMQGLIVLGYIGGGLPVRVPPRAVWPPAPRFRRLVFSGLLPPVIIWLLHASPSLFLLLFLNRTIRTIGPLVRCSCSCCSWAPRSQSAFSPCRVFSWPRREPAWRSVSTPISCLRA